MKYRIPLLAAILSVSASSYGHTQTQDGLHVWNEFIRILKTGQFPAERIRPHEMLGDSFKPILQGYLDSLRVQATTDDWNAVPEIIRAENRFQYIVPWSTSAGDKIRYCLSFVTHGSQWYFQHLETIFIRLDTVASLPATSFPDVTEKQKAWAREEIYWSFVLLNVYLPACAEKGRNAAMNQLRDGAGYFVSAKTWVPFAPAHRAFILYLCWEQANLRGNPVQLLRLTDDSAVVRIHSQFLELYDVAAHLKQRISLGDYRRIFESIWQDRAANAGWKVDIRYTENYEVSLVFSRSF